MGKLVQIKTKETKSSVQDFLNSVQDEQKRKDSLVILEMMKKASGAEPRMWGSSLIGFGNKRFKSPNTGREVDWFIIGFSPRKANLSLHLLTGLNKNGAIQNLGKFKTSAGCIYIKKLEDVDIKVLEELIYTPLQTSTKS